jgi:nucleoside-triphosphatase
VLAHVDLPGPPRAGRYGVDLAAFEHEVAIVDERGKMELASNAFREALAALLDRPVPVVATVQSASHAFKRRDDVETLRVTPALKGAR